MLRSIKCVVVAAALLAGAAAPDLASAHSRGGVRFGIHLGVPLFWDYPYPPAYRAYPPYYAYPRYYTYPPPVVVVPSSPPVYIERSDDEASPQVDDGVAAGGEGYWYYCYRPAGYYPAVKECPDGWEPVAPRSSR